MAASDDEDTTRDGTLRGDRDVSIPVHDTANYVRADNDWLLAQSGFPHRLRPGGFVYLRQARGLRARARVTRMEWQEGVDRPWRTGDNLDDVDHPSDGWVFIVDPDTWESVDFPLDALADNQKQGYRYLLTSDDGLDIRHLTADEPVDQVSWASSVSPPIDIFDDEGDPVRATCSIDRTAGGWAITMHSRGGTKDGRDARNPGYRRGLEGIATRLADSDAVLTEALLDSQPVRHLPAADRRLTDDLPRTLAHTDPKEVASELMRGAARITPDGPKASGGNPTKRIRLEVTLPGFDAWRDVVALVAGEGGTHKSRPSRTFVPADDLTVDDVGEAIAHARSIGRDELLAALDATAAERYVLVTDDGFEVDAKPLIQLAWNLKHPDNPIKANDFRGDRQSVAEPLRALGFYVDDRSVDVATAAPLGKSRQAYIDAGIDLTDDLDTTVTTKGRKEQSYVRGALGLYETDAAACWLCDRTFPVRLLVAAHIKPRKHCTAAERKDIPHIAMPACVLGCDALYEHGYITVVDGVVTVNPKHDLPPDTAQAIAQLDGRKVEHWGAPNATYFQWHHQRHVST
jgi:hypothetical protein